MAFQLTRTGLRPPDPDEVDALRASYAQRSCIRLPRFLEPALLGWLQQRIAGASWQELVHPLDPPVTDLKLMDPVARGALKILFQDPSLFAVVRDITGCDAIGSFKGRVYRMDPAAHHDEWHGDDDDNRLVTLSINLTDGVFAGGGLQLRRRDSLEVLDSVANTGPGDAIMFRIDHALEHRLSDVEGTVPKIAYAGWFQREPSKDFVRLVRSSAAW